MKKTKRYLQGGPGDASPDGEGGGGGVESQGGGYFDRPMPESKTGTMEDAIEVQRGLGLRDDGSTYSRIRGLGPGLAARQLEKQGVDIPGLIGNRTGSGFDAGPGFKKGGAVKKMAKGGSTSSASKRADGCAQRGKTKGRFV